MPSNSPIPRMVLTMICLYWVGSFPARTLRKTGLFEGPAQSLPQRRPGSFGWGIRALHQLATATMVPFPRRLPHSISPLEGDGFELPVPHAIRLRFRDFALARLR